MLSLDLNAVPRLLTCATRIRAVRTADSVLLGSQLEGRDGPWGRWSLVSGGQTERRAGAGLSSPSLSALLLGLLYLRCRLSPLPSCSLVRGQRPELTYTLEAAG